MELNDKVKLLSLEGSRPGRRTNLLRRRFLGMQTTW